MTMPDAILWSRADPDHGVALRSYEFLRKVLDALYEAINATLTVLQALGITELNIHLPSSMVIQIWDGETLNDFRLPEKRWKAVRVWIGGLSFEIPLPNIEVTDEWLDWLKAGTNIQGSEDWYYDDAETGETKLGTDFTPERKYNIFLDGWQDIKAWVIIIVICVILKKLHLFKAVRLFLARMFRWILGDVEQIEDIVEDIWDLLSPGMDDGINLITGKIAEIKALIGLRLAL